MRALAIAGVLFLLVLNYAFGLSEMLSYNDEYGTFDYRSLVYEASFDFIKTSPLFGDVDYLYSGYFDHLFTGLGIIDIVSVYLQFMLEYGLVGLVLFCLPFLIVVLSLTRQLLFSPQMDKTYQQYCAMYLSLLLGYLFVIATTSTVSLVDNFGIIFLAFGRALMEVVPREARSSSDQSALSLN
jgi:O-antigen ligase